jgi:hypothetical protein
MRDSPARGARQQRHAHARQAEHHDQHEERGHLPQEDRLDRE